MQKLPDLTDVNTDQQNGGLQELLNYDRVTAARLGQTPQSLDSALCSAFCQSEVSVIYTQLNQYYVVMEVAPQYWQDPSGLNNIYFKPPGSSSSTARAQHRFAAALRGETKHQHHAAAGGSHRALPFGHRLLQPEERRLAQRRHARSDADGSRPLGMPGTVHGFFAGTAQAYQQSLAI